MILISNILKELNMQKLPVYMIGKTNKGVLTQGLVLKKIRK